MCGDQISTLAPLGSLRPILHISQPNLKCIPPERLGLRCGKKWDATCRDTGFFKPQAGRVTINILNSQTESTCVTCVKTFGLFTL